MAEKVRTRGTMLARDLVWDWIKNWLVPLAPAPPAAAAWVAAQMDGWPVWFLILLSTAVFWMAASAVRAIVFVADRLQVRGRLVPVELTAARNLNATGKVIALAVGVRLKNGSQRDVEYEVERIRTEVSGRVNPAPNFANRGGVITPGESLEFRDDIVPLPPQTVGRQISGAFEIDATYGVPGQLKYPFRRRFLVFFKPLADGTVAFSYRTV